MSLAFDIGASFGAWSLAQKDCRIVAVEALPLSFERLCERTINHPIMCLNYAVCDSDLPTVIFHRSIHNPQISTLNSNWLTDEKSRFVNHPFERIIVRTISLDELILWYGIPDLIKIDVECSEDKVIKSLSTKVPLVCFEWASEYPEIVDICVDHLVKLGFREFHIQFEDEYTYRPEVFELDGGQLKAKIRTFTPRVEWGMIWSR